TFTTVVNFLIYNDNEEVFSSQYAFKCWERVGLQNISGVFRRNFLFFNTNHAASEEFRLGPGFALEYGWFRMDGAVAFSTAASVSDPAFLAVNIERNRPFGVVTLAVAASLPYGIGEQGNGDLIQHGPFPDSN
ncbi:MAG: hypothetical protein JNL28_03675, partial [Planctomycetes bacterium]|nr:hypothetical protein [Planctomycetota bacterium]